jgi:hypothetical protein
MNQIDFSFDIDRNSLNELIKYFDKDIELGDIVRIKNNGLKINVRPILIKEETDLLKEDNPVYTLSTRKPLFFNPKDLALTGTAGRTNGAVINAGEEFENIINTVDITYSEDLDTVKKKVEETTSYLAQYKDSIEMGVSSHTVEETVKTVVDEKLQDITTKVNDTETYLGIYKDKIESSVSSNDFTTTVQRIDGEVAAVKTTADSAKSYIEQNATKIETSVSSTVFNEEVTRLNTRIDNVSTESIFRVEIIATNGNLFTNGNVSTTLIARMYQGSLDITDSLPQDRFRWYRQSANPAADETWNNAHLNMKQVNITSDDVAVRAVFKCDVTTTSETQPAPGTGDPSV